MLLLKRDGKQILIRKKKITTFVLQEPKLVCSEAKKEDTEAMFIDPISKSGYIIQKVRPRNIVKSPVIFKVTLSIFIQIYSNDYLFMVCSFIHKISLFNIPLNIHC